MSSTSSDALSASNFNSGAAAVYDLTMPAKGIRVDDIHQRLRPLCKKYAFQLERGTEVSATHPEGILHYQCRVSLHKKKTKQATIKLLAEADIKGHVS